jgi:predicted secreted protein
VAVRHHEFVIELPSNRTTGHRWDVNNDKSLLELSNSNYKRVSEKIGGGGIEAFTFRACKKGKTFLRMVYKRPWEKTNAKEILYEVTVEDNT